MKKAKPHPFDPAGRIVANLRNGSTSKLAGIALVAIFALAACTAPGAPATPPPATDTRQTSAGTPAQESNSAETSSSLSTGVDLPLDFQLALYQGADVLGGQEVAFSGVVGQGKPVVLNFWAGLCPPCRVEMPEFQEVHEEFGDQVLFVGVDVGTFTGLGDEQDGRALLQEVGVTYPSGTTADAEVMRAYQVIGMPTTLFISPQGEIVERWTGLLTKDKLLELVEDLIEASAGS